MAERPRAVGAFVFAGGMTLGVSQHFDVECVLEKDKYGVATAELNMPDIRHVVGYDQWPAEIDRLKPDDLDAPLVDFIYGNPPCAAWSNAGAATKKGRTWDTSDLPDCTRRHFALIESLQPKAWAWESVQRAWYIGREFVDELALKARDLGYSTTILLHDAQNHGVPQRRQRFFMVAHRIPFDPRQPDPNGVSKTIDEALRELNDRGEPLERNLGKFRRFLADVKQGENLSSAWERLTPDDQKVVGARGQMVGRPPFTIKRARSGQPAPVVMHELLHPTEARGLSIKELAYLCGYPSMYEFVGAKDAGQVGRGVCPPVAAYLAGEVARAVRLDSKNSHPTFGPQYKLCDYTDRKNPRVEILEWPTPKSEETFAVRKQDDVENETQDDESDVAPTPSIAFGAPKAAVAPATLGESYDEKLGRLEKKAKKAAKKSAPDTGEVGSQVPAAPATVTLGDDLKPNGLGSGAYIRELLKLGKGTDEILDLVHANFPGSKAKASDVSWNRRKLKQSGLQAQREEKDGEAAQPLRTGPRLSVDPEREFDKSSLRANAHGQWVHRDYAAHFFRWGFAGRFSGPDKDVLDIGCGPDVPMINALTMPRSNVPHSYVGVDMNKEPRKAPSRQWAELHWEFDFTKRWHELGRQFDLITSFEVIEHMRRPDGDLFLAGVRECLNGPEARALISTPVFNGKAAANHLHEWTIEELAGAIDGAGLRVVKRFGTFASWNELKKVAAPEHVAFAKAIMEYYDGEVISCFLAPLYPDASRNNIWVLALKE